MADTTIQMYATAFSDNIKLLARQKASKMMGKVMMKPSVKGSKFTQERIGTWDMDLKAQGIIDTPMGDPGYSRRTCTMATYKGGKGIARDEDLKTVVKPESPWVASAVSAYGNQIDTVVYAALGGNAYSGVDGETAVALPASQKLATVAGEVLDTDFIIDVKTKLDAANIPSEGRMVMINPTDLNEMLRDTKVTSDDYATVKALVRGEINTWMGFEFISTTNATAGKCYFYHRDAVVLGLNEQPFVRIDERADKAYAKQIYFELNLGATRLEEEGVVEVTITPAP